MANKSACAIAALLLALMISAVFINSKYVENTADHILSVLNELPDDMSDSVFEIREISDYWEKRKLILTITLSEPKLDAVSSLFDDLLINAEEGKADEYKKSMAQLKRAIENIRKFEEFSIENIF